MDSMNFHVINELPKTCLGKGPLWDANALIYVDIAEGMIHRHSFEKSMHETISVGENVGFAVYRYARRSGSGDRQWFYLPASI
jgi:sugar lactone lactonase YvrE